MAKVMNLSEASVPTTADPASAAGIIPIGQKLAYAAGNTSTIMGKQATKSFTYQIYNIELGLRVDLIGTIIALSRLWDAITDPVIGTISDRFASRFGRRRPFIFVGSILSGLSFALLWWFPAGQSDGFYFIYYTACALLFYTALSIYAVPWYALGYELTPDYDERTRVMSFVQVFNVVAILATSWLYFFVQQFDDVITGVRWVGTVTGIGITVFGLIPALLARERFAEPQVTSKAKRVGVVQSLAQASRNRAFVLLTIAVTMTLLGMSMVGTLLTYINIFYIFGGDKGEASFMIGMSGTVQQAVSLIAIPVVDRLAKHFGKRPVIAGATALGVVAYMSTWFLFDPATPWLQLIFPLLIGPASLGIFLLCHAMVADVCDEDELLHGTRREGLFGAIYSWTFTMGIALAFLISGYLLVWIGFDADQGAAQSESTLLWLRVLYATVPSAALLVALVCLLKYPLTKAHAQATRAELERRRGQV